MRVFGEPVRAEDAKRLGIIERIVEGNLLACAVQFAREIQGISIRRTRRLADTCETRECHAALFIAHREKVRNTRKNLLASNAAVEMIEVATEHGVHWEGAPCSRVWPRQVVPCGPETARTRFQLAVTANSCRRPSRFTTIMLRTN